MSVIEIPPGPRRLCVRWGCRRCGHTGGVASTTLPLVTLDWSEAMMRNLLDSLRLKLVHIHMRGQGCIATPDDFVLERGAPADAEIAGLV